MLTSTDPDGVATTRAYTPDGNSVGITYPEVLRAPGHRHLRRRRRADRHDRRHHDLRLHLGPVPGAGLSNQRGGTERGYGYDADGDTTGITYPLPATATWAASDTVSYGYDKTGTLTSVTDFDNTLALPASMFGYHRAAALASDWHRMQHGQHSSRCGSTGHTDAAAVTHASPVGFEQASTSIAEAVEHGDLPGLLSGFTGSRQPHEPERRQLTRRLRCPRRRREPEVAGR
jgi:YD repeat-containing protein